MSQWKCSTCECVSDIEQKSCPNGCDCARNSSHPFADNRVPENETDEQKLARLERENVELRRMWWFNHGCEFSALYGDDGEMQCGSCLIDFKRDTVETIGERILSNALKSISQEDLRDMFNKI